MVDLEKNSAQIISEEPLKEVLDGYVRKTMKKYVPVFWIPVVGDKCIDKIMTSEVANYVWGSYAMLCMM